MNPQSLEKNLNNIERELVNLQTAHEVGLGSVQYWNYEGANPAVYEDTVLYLKVWTKANENPAAILNFYTDSDIAGLSGVIKSTTYQDRYLLLAFSFAPGTPIINWKLVATSQVEYAQLNTPEEAIAWLGTY